MALTAPCRYPSLISSCEGSGLGLTGPGARHADAIPPVHAQHSESMFGRFRGQLRGCGWRRIRNAHASVEWAICLGPSNEVERDCGAKRCCFVKWRIRVLRFAHSLEFWI